MRVDVAGQQFTFPAICACCTGPATRELTVSATKKTGKKVVHTKTNAWDFPYCVHCIAHVAANDKANSTYVLLVFLSLLVAAVLGYTTRGLVGIVVFIASLVGATKYRNGLVEQAKALMTANCACLERAVVYLGWQSQLHQFEMQSRAFAQEFMVANQKKLVNLTSDAQQILQNDARIAHAATGARRARRYET